VPADVTSALLDLSTAFASLRARWFVFGAQAVIAAGVPRLTADVDVTVEIAGDGLPSLLDALQRNGFALRDVGEDVTAFIGATRVVPAAHTSSGIPIDIVLAGAGLEQEMLERVQPRTIRGVEIPFIATADLIALKVLAGRGKDLDDVRALLRASPADLSIDEARARVAQLADLLEDSSLLAQFDEIAATKAR
jgi:hypothetical protein